MSIKQINNCNNNINKLKNIKYLIILKDINFFFLELKIFILK